MGAELDESVSQVICSTVAPAVIFEFPSERIVAASPAATQLLAGGDENVVGRDLEEFAADHPTGALDLLVAGRLSGYEAVRELRRPGADPEPTHVWLRRVGSDAPPQYVLAVFGSGGYPACVPAPPGRSDEQLTAVLGTTDNALQINRVSLDVEGWLGYQGDELINQSLFTLFDSASIPALLWALAQAASGSTGVTLPVSVLAQTWEVLPCDALVVALAPANTFGFALLPPAASNDSPADGVGMTEAVWRLSRGSTALWATSSAEAPVAGEPSVLSKLTSRELEIVLRLLAGDRVPEIARSLYLAQGTVRNHLSSVFRRLGISSQQELISLLRGHSATQR